MTNRKILAMTALCVTATVGLTACGEWCPGTATPL
ncbi:hypothetical protein QFZ67_000438 [Streptomyces sp. V1I1]|nr:hypothetical protein [Streptomyces sp. V1I1]